MDSSGGTGQARMEAEVMGTFALHTHSAASTWKGCPHHIVLSRHFVNVNQRHFCLALHKTGSAALKQGRHSIRSQSLTRTYCFEQLHLRSLALDLQCVVQLSIPTALEIVCFLQKQHFSCPTSAASPTAKPQQTLETITQSHVHNANAGLVTRALLEIVT